jgi:hypothetical protein
MSIKYISGGSLSISTYFPWYGVTTTFGSTTSYGSSFAISNLYTFALTEVLNLTRIRGSIALVSTGATTVCSIVRALGPGIVPQ